MFAEFPAFRQTAFILAVLGPKRKTLDTLAQLRIHELCWRSLSTQDLKGWAGNRVSQEMNRSLRKND